MKHSSVARPIVAALVVAMLGACASYGGSKTTAKVGGVMTLVGLASAVAASFLGAGNGRPSEDTPLKIGVFGVVFVGTPGVLMVAGGLIGMAVNDKPMTITPPTDTPTASPPERVSPSMLYQQAKAAAAANDCATVLVISSDVQLADQPFWNLVFSKEPSIGRCLGLSGATRSHP